MNQDKFQKGIEDIKKIQLNQKEKSLLFNRLEEYSNTERVNSPLKISKVYWYQSMFQPYYTKMAFALVILVGGGGLVLGSNNALPGEFLYSVKVNLSEPLRGVALVNPSAKINWEIEKLERRFEEIEVLAVQGKLDQSKSLEAQIKIEGNRESFNALIKKAESKDSEVLADDFRNTLEAKEGAHQRVLEKLEDYSSPNLKDEIVRFRNSVAIKEEETADVASVSMMATITAKVAPKESKFSTTTYEKKKKAIEDKIEKAEKSKIESNSSNKTNSKLKQDILEDFKNDLKEAKRIYEEAKEKENSGNFEEANQNLSNSLRNLESAGVSLKQGMRFGEDD